MWKVEFLPVEKCKDIFPPFFFILVWKKNPNALAAAGTSCSEVAVLCVIPQSWGPETFQISEPINSQSCGNWAAQGVRKSWVPWPQGSPHRRVSPEWLEIQEFQASYHQNWIMTILGECLAFQWLWVVSLSEQGLPALQKKMASLMPQTTDQYSEVPPQ